MESVKKNFARIGSFLSSLLTLMILEPISPASSSSSSEKLNDIDQIKEEDTVSLLTTAFGCKSVLKLGSGYFGEVYQPIECPSKSLMLQSLSLSSDTTTTTIIAKPPIACKIYRKGKSKTVNARFKQFYEECKLVSKLVHPNIVKHYSSFGLYCDMDDTDEQYSLWFAHKRLEDYINDEDEDENGNIRKIGGVSDLSDDDDSDADDDDGKKYRHRVKLDDDNRKIALLVGISMEKMTMSLCEWIKHTYAWSPSVVSDKLLHKIFIQIGNALQYMHKVHHAVHNDIKLDNIGVLVNDDYNRSADSDGSNITLKLLDFGVSMQKTLKEYEKSAKNASQYRLAFDSKRNELKICIDTSSFPSSSSSQPPSFGSIFSSSSSSYLRSPLFASRFTEDTKEFMTMLAKITDVYEDVSDSLRRSVYFDRLKQQEFKMPSAFADIDAEAKVDVSNIITAGKKENEQFLNEARYWVVKQMIRAYRRAFKQVTVEWCLKEYHRICEKFIE